MESMTRHLANRVANIKFEDLPQETIQMTKQYILDYLGVSIRGWTQKNMDIMSETLGNSADGTKAIMLNGKKGASNSVLYSAMLNAAASHSQDFDDLHNPSIIHMACVTVPSALAVAEDEELSGKDILAALVAGYEAGARIGESVNPEAYYFWHTTSTCGVFSSAVTVANLKKFNTGILSAKLTANGFTAAEKILDGDKGFCRAMLTNPHWEKLTEDIKGFKIDNNSFKPFSCCKYTHPSSYAAQLLRNEQNLKLEDVEKVTIRSNRIVKQLVDNSHPKNPYGAKFSIQYCVATMIKYGKLGIDQFVDENLNNDEIQRVMQNIEVIVDPQLDKEYTEKPDRWAVELTIACKDGKTYTKFVEYPKGDPPNPMTWDETVEKFMDLSVPVYGEEVCKKLVNLVATLDEHDNFKKALAECF